MPRFIHSSNLFSPFHVTWCSVHPVTTGYVRMTSLSIKPVARCWSLRATTASAGALMCCMPALLMSMMNMIVIMMINMFWLKLGARLPCCICQWLGQEQKVHTVMNTKAILLYTASACITTCCVCCAVTDGDVHADIATGAESSAAHTCLPSRDNANCD